VCVWNATPARAWWTGSHAPARPACVILRYGRSHMCVHLMLGFGPQPPPGPSSHALFPPMTFCSILHFFQLRPLSFLLRCTHHAACGRQVAHDEVALPTAVVVTRLNENAHTHTLVSLRARPLQVLSARQHGKCLWKPVQGASAPHPPFPVPARAPQPQHPRTNHMRPLARREVQPVLRVC
jgi:hypothetical protein